MLKLEVLRGTPETGRYTGLPPGTIDKKERDSGAQSPEERVLTFNFVWQISREHVFRPRP